MSELSKIMERVTNSLKKGLSKTLAFLGWLMVILQNLAIALYKQLHYDFDLVLMRIRGSSKNLKGHPISSWADIKEIALEWVHKTKLGYWYPLLQARQKQVVEMAIVIIAASSSLK